MATLLTAITNSDWQLVARSNDLAIQGAVLVRKVPYINAANGLTLATTQEASASESSPYASGVSHTGTFAKARVELQEGTGDRDDGNARYNVLVETLIKVATVADVNALAALTSRPADAHEIRNLFGFEEGDGYTRGFVWDNIAANQRDECMALTADNLLKRVMFADNVDDWATATAYTSSPLSLVVNDDVVYSCYSAHTSEAQWEPGTGANWTDKWHEYGAAWASGAAYKTGEVSTSGGFFYVALSNHTAGANFAADYEVSAPKWRRFWAFADRKFDVTERAVGRFAVLFARNDWANTWSANVKETGRGAGEGLDHTRQREASGLDRGQAIGDFKTMSVENPSAWAGTTAYYPGDCVRESNKNYICKTEHTSAVFANEGAYWDEGSHIISSKDLREQGNGKYGITAKESAKYEGVAESDAQTIKLEGEQGGALFPKNLVRVWYRRSATALATLIGGSGNAISDAANYAWPNQAGGTTNTTFTHRHVKITDHRDGAYTVTQYLVDTTDTTNIYWTKNWTETKVFTRTSDDLTKTVTYRKYVTMKTQLADAWGEPDGAANVVAGTTFVKRLGPMMYQVSYMTRTSTGNWV